MVSVIEADCILSTYIPLDKDKLEISISVFEPGAALTGLVIA